VLKFQLSYLWLELALFPAIAIEAVIAGLAAVLPTQNAINNHRISTTIS